MALTLRNVGALGVWVLQQVDDVELPRARVEALRSGLVQST